MKCSLFGAAIVVALTTVSGSSRAATEIGLGATYDPRIPIGTFRRFAPDVAFGGLQTKFDYYPLDSFSLGVVVQYQLFQRGDQTNTTSITNGAVTAQTFHYVSIWSLLPTANYYFLSGPFRPYASLAAGVTSTTYAALASDIPNRKTTEAFILQPSVGVLWKLSPDAKVEERPAGYTRKPLESMFGLTASLTYAFTTADVIGASNIAYAGIQVGIYAKP